MKKKILCLCLSIIFIMLVVAPSISVGAAEQTEETTVSAMGALSYTCVYDVSSKKIIVEGTVSHDFLVKHNDYKIRVYSISPGQTYEDVVDNAESVPCGSSDIAVKFSFAIAVKGILERYCSYAVVMTDPSGNNHYTCEPMMPSISSNFVYDPADRSGFKGIVGTTPYGISQSGAGTVIVEVDVSKTLGNAADGIPYPMSNAYTSIKKSYIESIDKQVMAATLQGSRVYIRFVLTAADPLLSHIYEEGSEAYTLPKLGSEYALEYIFTVSKFIAERYNGEQYGKVSGAILGKAIDDTSLNLLGDMDINTYAELYTLGLVVVGNAARGVRADFDIVIPLSDTNDYTANGATHLDIRPSDLLALIVSRLDKNVSGTFDHSVMLECTGTPLTLDADGKLVAKENKDRIGADNISAFTSYLKALGNMHSSIPTSVIYMWTPEADLSGNLLCASYIYNYLRLFENQYVSSFVIDTDKDKFIQLTSTLKYIDTDNFDKLTAIAEYYGYTSWETLMNAPVNIYATRTLIEKSFFTKPPQAIMGEFVYTDFASTSVYSIMSTGQNTTHMRPSNDADGSRGLGFETGKLGISEAAEVIGVFEYAESYEYTEYLSLRIGVTDKTATENALYRVDLTVGNGANKMTVEGIIRNTETPTLYFDVSEFAQKYRAEYISISISPLTESSQGCSVQLTELRGHSKTYNSIDLKELIEARRAEYLDSSLDEESGFDIMLVLTLVGIVFAMVVIGIGLTILFSREDKKGT